MESKHQIGSVLLVSDVMTKNPLTVAASDSVWHTTTVMMNAEVRHLPVIKNGILIGMVSDRDIRSYEVPLDEAELENSTLLERLESPIGDIATRDVVTVRANTPLSEAIEQMLHTGFGALPVTDETGTSLEGIISYVDILRTIKPWLTPSS